jgi:hypothetical protein
MQIQSFMKKLILFFMFLIGVGYTLQAQSTNLKDYAGKYVFEAGSPVAEVTITVEDSSLVINSAMGSTPISKKGVDTFYLAQYDANVVFKRGANNQVIELSIAVQGMDLKGKKEETPTPTSGKEEIERTLFDVRYAK